MSAPPPPPERIAHWVAEALAAETDIARRLALSIVEAQYRRLFEEWTRAVQRVAQLEANLAARPRLELVTQEGVKP